MSANEQGTAALVASSVCPLHRAPRSVCACSTAASAASVAFGTHAAPDLCAYTGPLTFSGEGEDGMPRWERHDGCTAVGRYITTICPTSKRVDDPTLHSTRFDGDDPYTICVYCGETRDARSGRIIKPAKASPGDRS